MSLKKNNWAYEKIGDISEKILAGGDKPKVFSEVMTNECYIPVYANGVYNNGLCGYTNMPIIKDECITISARGTIGFCCIRTTPFVPIVRLIVVVPKSSIANKFLCYTLRNLNIEKNGGTIPQLTVPMIKGYVIPIPPLPEQSRIVEELDLLSNIIEKKRQQLSELDNLAQSIFYDMFGDPVTNEKGWEVITLGDKCDVTSFKRVLIEEVVDEGIPFIRGTELMALSKGENVDFTLFITDEHYARVKAISDVPKVGDLLIPSINAEARIWILNTDKPMYYKDGRVLWVHVDEKSYASECLKYIMHELIKSSYSSVASGATFAELKLFVLRELKTILPPLSLQQLFAKKIEAIEKEKGLIKQSIAETEELFNSRMDYYFS